MSFLDERTKRPLLGGSKFRSLKPLKHEDSTPHPDGPKIIQPAFLAFAALFDLASRSNIAAAHAPHQSPYHMELF
jgi:hypothetical protein